MPTYADMLRGNRTMGALGALSGDKVLQPFGQKLVNQNTITPKDAIALQSAIEARRVRANQAAERLRDARSRTKLWAEDLGIRRQDAMQRHRDSMENTSLLRGIQQQQADTAEQRRTDKVDIEAAKLKQQQEAFGVKMAETRAARAQRTAEAVTNYAINLGKLGVAKDKVALSTKKAQDDAQWKADVLTAKAEETERTLGIRESVLERHLANDKVASEQWKATFDQRERKQAASKNISYDKLTEYRNENARREARFRAEQEQDEDLAANRLKLNRDKYDQGVRNDATRKQQIDEQNRIKMTAIATNLGAKYAALMQRRDLSKMTDQELAALADKSDLDVEKLQRLKNRDMVLKQQAQTKIADGRRSDAEKLGVDIMEWQSTMMDRANKTLDRNARRENAKREHADTLELNYKKLEGLENWRDAQEREWTSKRQQLYSDMLAREGARDGRLATTLKFRREQEQRMVNAQNARDKQFYDKMNFTATEREKDRQLRRDLANEKRLAEELQTRPVKRQDRDSILKSTFVIDGLQSLLTELEDPESQVKPLQILGMFSAPTWAQKYMHSLASSETKAGNWLPESYAHMSWMQKYKLYYSAYERHKLFGAALTKVELPEWESMSITPSTSVEKAKEWLQDWIKRAKANAGRLKATMDSENYSPATLDLMLPYGEEKGR